MYCHQRMSHGASANLCLTALGDPLPAMHRFNPIRLILNNIRWGLMDAKFRGENLLREGRVPYTVIRPGDPPFIKPGCSTEASLYGHGVLLSS